MNRLRVLTFHRIADRDCFGSYDPKLISASPEGFAEQISWLARNYRVVTAEEVLSARANATRLPRNALLITFDDAYPDFRTVAWPILKRYSLPVVLFVPTAYPGNPQMPFWWDSLHAALLDSKVKSIQLLPFGRLPLNSTGEKNTASALIRTRVKQLPHDEAMAWLSEIKERLGCFEQKLVSTLTWSELRSLAREGVTLGAHGRSHALLTAISSQQLQDEVAGAMTDLQREVGDALPIFCYPAGAWDADVLEEVDRAGVRLGFTTDTGHNDLHRCNPLAMRRLNITPRTTLRILKARLTVAGAYVDRKRRQWLC